jgi:glycolate oxidase FAD binding subunit
MIRYEKIAGDAGITAAFICRAGNGIIYSYITEKTDTSAKISGLVELIGKLTAEAVRDEGNLVVESGPRELKEKVGVWGKPRPDQVLMRRLKEKMDPAGILNPGRFVGGI